MAIRRINKELMSFEAEPSSSCSAGPEGEDIFHWLSRRCILLAHSLPERLLIQTSEASVRNENISSKYQQLREHFSRYSQRSMEPSPHNLEIVVLCLLFSLTPILAIHW